MKTAGFSAVDPGEKRIGLAVSDPSATISRPLQVLPHVSRVVDAATIAQIARDQGAIRIIVGQALDWDGQVGPAARRAARIAEEIGRQIDLPVVLWDESSSTQDALSARLAMGVKRQKRSGHLDDLAASVILQSYLEAQRNSLPSLPEAPQED